MTSIMISEFDAFIKNRRSVFEIPAAEPLDVIAADFAEKTASIGNNMWFFGDDPANKNMNTIVGTGTVTDIDIVYLIGIKYKDNGLLKVCQLQNSISNSPEKTLKSCAEQMIGVFDTNQEHIFRYQYNFKDMRFQEKCYLIYCLFNETNAFLPVGQFTGTRPLMFLPKKPNGLQSREFDQNKTFNMLTNEVYYLNGKPLSCIQIINQYKDKNGSGMKKGDQSTNYYFELYVAQKLENGDMFTPFEIVIFDPTTGNDGPK
ncbi:MAG: hypothetical protein AABY88_07005 [Pseudomonadota bacterium]